MRKRRSLMQLATPLMAGRGIAAMFTFLIPVMLARLLAQPEYGTYKQFFLIASTVYMVGQLGLVGSLYYFVPRSDRDGRGRILVQTLLGLFVVGAVFGAGVYLGAGAIARRFSNPSLTPLALPLALYVWTFLGSTPLEAALTTSKRTGWAGFLYVASDVVRTAALIIPIKLGGTMVGLAWAVAGWSALRLVAAWALILSGRLGRPHWPTRALAREQLRYALPSAGALLLTTAQIQLPQYLVAALTDAATYAIYAVGLLQIPLSDLLYSPIAEVMMVRLSQAGPAGAPPIFREAIARLVIFFLPLTAFVVGVGPELIPTLYTQQYVASVPIFLIAVWELPLMALPVDGLLRSLDMTSTMFWISLVRLGIAVVAVPVGLALFGLPGAMLAYVISQWSARVLLLRSAGRRLGVSPLQLIPWVEVRAWALRAALVFAGVAALRRFGPWHGWLYLGIASAVGAAIWGLALLSARELRAPREAGLSTPSVPPAPVAAASTPPIIKEMSSG